MADDELDELGVGEDDDQRRGGIARPGLDQQPMALRGISPKPADSTADASSSEPSPLGLGNNPYLAAPESSSLPATSRAPASTGPLLSPAVASPLEQQTAKDRANQSRLSRGSGITQFSHNHPIAGGVLRGLNVAGELASSIFPAGNLALRAIPGTEEHHNMLVEQNTGAINTDEAQADKEAQTGEAQARTGQAEATTQNELAEAEKNRQLASVAANPKPEKPEDLQHELADATQDAIIRGVNPNDDPKVKQISDVITSLQKQSQPKTPNDFEQYYGDWLKDNNLPDSAHNRLMARKEYAKAGQPFGQQHLDIALKNESTKEQEQKDKQVAPYQQIVETADEAHRLQEMANQGNAPADVDLALAFFKTMRGQGGSIRFTQQEQKMILGARSSGQDLTALAQKVMGGGQALTPDQRSKMVAVIDMHAQVAKQAMERIQGGGGNQNATEKDLGAASAGKSEGSTGALPDGTKVVVKGGRLVAQ